MADDPIRARTVLARWLRASKLDSELLPHVIAQRWPSLVGERIAHRTRPEALRDGELTVEVASNAWLNELSFLRQGLLDAINRGLQQLGDGERPAGRRPVRDLRLVVGRRAPRRTSARGATPTTARARPLLTVARSMDLPLELQVELSRLRDPELARAIRHAWTLAEHFAGEVRSFKDGRD